MIKHLFIICFFLLFLSTLINAQQKDIRTSFRFPEGTWISEGTGKPGEGSGSFTFKFDLDENIFVRKNITEFPATKDKPASIHKDILVIYSSFKGIAERAIYFDNEGHTINYSIDAGKSKVVFTSDSISNMPKFRLSYILEESGRLLIRFEMSKPDKPENFFTYLEGYALKKQ